MPAHGITPKEAIEGPPRRRCPVLLRQTSFKALDERIIFPSEAGEPVPGRHRARFGEVEQRGVALTRPGRALYDAALAAARHGEDRFGDLPDDWEALRIGGLAYFHYSGARVPSADLGEAIAAGDVAADPVIYEDFLPVSAAGIFQSNLGDEARGAYRIPSSRASFEAALGAAVLDEFALYDQIEARSLLAVIS